MLNKKIFLILGIFLLAFAPLVSAVVLSKPSTWDDTIQFYETSPNGKYGYYEIGDTLLWIFNKKQIKTVELIENDYSLLTAWNIKQVETFEVTRLFDKTDYFAKDKKTDKKNSIKSEQHFYRELKTKSRLISVYDCVEYNSVNKSNCDNYKNNSYTEEYNEWSEWINYNWQNVNPGIYQIKTIVTRSSQSAGAIDWIDTSEGHKLSEWAVWWDNDWEFRRPIEITETSGESFTNYSTLMYIPYNSSMEVDFRDLRFLDSTNEIELDYFIENKTNSSFAWIWVKVPTLTASSTTNINMYYGNNATSSNSDIFNTFIYGNDGTVNDFSEVTTCTSSIENETLKFVSGASWSMCTHALDSVSSGIYEIDFDINFQSGSSVRFAGLTMSDTTQPTPSAGYNNRIYHNLLDNSGALDFSVWDNDTGVVVTTDWALDTWLSIKQDVDFSTLNISSGVDTIFTNAAGTEYTYTDSSYRGSFDDVGRLNTLGYFNAVFWVDNITYREKAATEPTYAIGPEEEAMGVFTVLIYPANNDVISDELGEVEVNFNFSSTATDTNLTNATLYLWYSNGTLILTDFSTLSGNDTVTNFSTNLTQGNYKWNAETCGSSVNCTFDSSNNSFIVHTGLPEILIEEPVGILGSIVIGGNETLNYTISETGQNVSTHLVECWYEYNNTETLLPIDNSTEVLVFPSNYANVTEIRDGSNIASPIPGSCSRRGNFTATTNFGVWQCLDENDNYIDIGDFGFTQSVNTNITAMLKRPLNCSSNLEIFEYVEYKNSLCVHVLDEFGLHSQENTSWEYNYTEKDISFINNSIEGATETFSINFTISSLKQVSSVDLVYNNTAYSTQFLSISNNITAFIDLVIPNVDATTNQTFYFSILFSDGTIINSSTNQIEISQLMIDNCSAYSNLIYNYTHRDEESQSILTDNSIELSLDIWDLQRTQILLNFSTEYNNTNPAQVCLNINLTDTTIYSIDSVVKYTSNESSGYALEYYNILNDTLSNSTIPNNIDLYSLLDEDSTEFQLIFRDSDLALASNILVSVDRQYVANGDFKTVERPVTDSNGQAVLHLVRNDIQYNFIMTNIAGEVVGVFNKKNVFCQDFTIGSCTLTLNAIATTENIFDLIEDVGILYSTEYNNVTNILSLEFISNDLTPKTVGLIATRDTDFGNRSVCNEELISSSGIITCDVSDIVSTDRFLFLEIYVEDSLKATEIEDLEAENTGSGVNGLFLAFFLFLTFILIFSEDKMALVVGIVLGWVASISLGLLKGTLFGALSAGTWLVVTAIIFLWKLKREEGQ